MYFHVTEEHHIGASDEPGRTETDGNSFASEGDLRELASEWPMKRLVEIWNRLPGVQPVARFTDRKTAVARIWRALQPQAEKPVAKETQRPSKTRHRPLFREGSKAAQVLTLLSRLNGRPSSRGHPVAVTFLRRTDVARIGAAWLEWNADLLDQSLDLLLTKIQKQYGDWYWRAVDSVDPNWLERILESVVKPTIRPRQRIFHHNRTPRDFSVDLQTF